MRLCAVLLPIRAVEKPENLSISVKNGNIIKITVRWPSAMCCVQQLALTGEDGREMKHYHPKILIIFTFL